MIKIRLSRRAEADLFSIGEYTLRTWGVAQTDVYLRRIRACCRSLEESPQLGRPCDEIRPGLRRIEHDEHVLFYRQNAQGILVWRILHRSMLPQRHPIVPSNLPRRT